jgi:hypothetical protein
MLGASDSKSNASKVALTTDNGAVTGSETISEFNEPNFFGRYEKNKFMVAGEYNRIPVAATIQFPGPPPPKDALDLRAWYGMASYRLTAKLTAGAYESQYVNRQAALGPARYQKDWAFSGRYDFNEFLYAKAEQHLIDGTAIGYDATLNPNGLQPNAKLIVLKLGVSF